MIYRIVLTESVNQLPFGSFREDVRKALGGKVEEFKKGPFSRNTSDAFSDCVAFYTPDNKLEAIEFDSEAFVTVNGIPFEWNWAAARHWLKAMDPEAQEDASGITSSALGVGMYVEGGKLLSVLFAGADYYSFLSES